MQARHWTGGRSPDREESMARYECPGFTLGCTSFVRPASYVEGVRFGAALCRDVSVLLFESGAHGECPLTEREAREIARIGDGEGTTFSVHLPVDGDFSTPEGALRVQRGALAAVDRAAPLRAHSFVLHVAFPACTAEGRAVTGAEAARAAAVLESIGRALPSPGCLALENLEGYGPGFLDPWLNGAHAGPAPGWARCADIGHLWKDFRQGGRSASRPGERPAGRLGSPDPPAVLADWLPRVRICHLHGVRLCGDTARDHVSLAHMPVDQLDAALHLLWERAFSGVVTLEVFSPEHLAASHRAILESHERFTQS